MGSTPGLRRFHMQLEHIKAQLLKPEHPRAQAPNKRRSHHDEKPAHHNTAAREQPLPLQLKKVCGALKTQGSRKQINKVFTCIIYFQRTLKILLTLFISLNTEKKCLWNKGYNIYHLKYKSTNFVLGITVCKHVTYVNLLYLLQQP